LYSNGSIVFEGYIQLQDVLKSPNASSWNEDDMVSYNIILMDSSVNFFTSINDLNLDDINFKLATHTLTRENILATSGNTYLNTYKYIQFYSIDPNNYYYPTDYWPSIYATAYIDRIIQDAGFSYNDDYLATGDYAKFIVPYTGKDFKKSLEALNEEKFYVGFSGTVNDNQCLTTNCNIASTKFTFNLTNTYPYYLNANNYPIASSYKAYTGGKKSFTFNLNCLVRLVLPTSHPSYTTIDNYTGFVIELYKNNVLIKSIMPVPNNATHTHIGATPVLDYNYSQSVIFTDIDSNTNDIFDIRYKVTPINFHSKVYITFGSNNAWSVSQEDGARYEGDTIDINDFIPANINQKLFLGSYLKTFNLIMDSDKSETNKFIIKQRDEYYNTNVYHDWTSKLDRSQQMQVKYLADLQNKEIVLQFKDGSDEWSSLYKKNYNENFGRKKITFDSELLTGTDTKESIFTTTPNVWCGNLVVPAINSQQPDGLKLLYDGGIETGTWTFKSSASTTDLQMSAYTYAGHLDNPAEPTFDLNFDTAIAYYVEPLFYTQNNLYNLYHSNTIKQISEGRQLTAYFLLNESDIATLSLSDKIIVDNVIYVINEIKDYNPSKNNSLTQVVLNTWEDSYSLVPPKKKAIVWTGNTIGVQPHSPFSQWKFNKKIAPTAKVNFINGSQIDVGDYSQNINILANYTSIGSSAKNINILGCDNVTVPDLAQNITLLAITGKTLTSSDNNKTFIGGDSVIFDRYGEISQGIKKIIRTNDYIVVKPDFQYHIYDDFTVNSGASATALGEIVVENGDLILGGNLTIGSTGDLRIIDELSGATGSGGVSIHNLLSGLQGGAPSEYYHLNATQFNNLSGLTASTQVYYSAGLLQTPSYNDNGDGTMSLGSADVTLYDNATYSGMPLKYTVASAITTTTPGLLYLPNNSTSYIVINYNGGNPRYEVVTDVELITESSVVPVITIFRYLTTLHNLNWNGFGAGLANKLNQRFVKTERIVRESGLALTTDAGTGSDTGGYGDAILISSGRTWNGAARQAITSADSLATASTITYLCYQSGTTGNWIVDTAPTGFINTHYWDSATISLQTLNNDKYVNNYIYRGVEDDSHIYIVLGEDGEHSNLAQAQAETIPMSLPALITSHALLVGRIIAQEGTKTATEIDSAFVTILPSGIVTNHNDLNNIQGGDISNRWHLTLAEYNKLTALPSSLTNNLGNWNANTNTPTITSGTGSTGDWYTVSVSGTTDIDGINLWGVGDYIWFDGSTMTWQKINNQVGVTTTPGGINTSVQFNDFGTFGGNSGFTYNKTTGGLSIATPLNSTSINSNGLRLTNSPLNQYGLFLGNTTSAGFGATIKGVGYDSNDVGLLVYGQLESSASTGNGLILRSSLSAGTLTDTQTLLQVQNYQTPKMTMLGNGNTLFGYQAAFAASPELPFHFYPGSGAQGFPATTGSVQTGVMRIGGVGTNGVLDIGNNAGNGSWLQVTNRTALNNYYPLLLNPNGGNIGIGTTATTATMQLHKPTNANNYLKFTNNDTGSAVGDGFDVGITTTEKAIVWNYEATAMDFATNNTMSMSISSGGTVSTVYDMLVNSLTVGRGTSNDVNSTAIGYRPLYLATTASTNNTAIGYQAMYYSSAATNNTAIGRTALTNLTNGSGNVSIGYNSSGFLSAGTSNVVIGNSAMLNGTSVTANTAIGVASLYGASKGNIGSYNIGLGHYAGRYASSSNELYIDSRDRTTNANEKTQSIIYGVMAATPSAQTLSLNANVTTPYDATINGLTVGKGANNGVNSTALGIQALKSNTSGQSNCAIGAYSLWNNTTGTGNMAVGGMLNNISGDYNVAIGGTALNSNTSGSSNTAIGNTALFTNSTGSTNIAIGFAAGYYATGNNEFYLDNTKRASNAVEKTNALMYGVMGATPAAQSLNINATTRIGNSTGYTQVDSNGHMTMVGSATYWDDLRFDPTVRGTGANTPAFEQYLTNGAGSRGVYLYSFDNALVANEKEVFFNIQLPHGWAFTPIHVHTHWIAPVSAATATVIWGLEYTWAGIGSTFGNTTIIYSDGINYVSGGTDSGITAYRHYLSELPDITPNASQDYLSSILICRLFRASSHTADTYTNKVGLLYSDAHVEYNQLGSNQEYVK
jgi:hypothetical protein